MYWKAKVIASKIKNAAIAPQMPKDGTNDKSKIQ